MNIVKYYGQDKVGRPILVRIHIPKGQKYGTRAGHTGIAKADAMALSSGLSRHRPAAFGPHAHPAQQSGYHQPSEQQLRRARRKTTA